MALGAMGLLSACGGSGASDPGPGGVSLGSNQSDAIPRKALAEIVERFQATSGLSVNVNTVERGAYQEQINAYLQADPDDVFSWFSGQRMRYFAKLGLISDVDDAWDRVEGGFARSVEEACTGDDGKKYLIPYATYPWVISYRPSVFREHGWSPPGTLDELQHLASAMQAKGITPLGFAAQGGWEAFGMFDVLNMRLNGFDFHQRLLTGGIDWTDRDVKRVFELWRDLLPLHQGGALGRGWQDSARALQNGTVGMFYFGTFVAQQFQDAEDPGLLEDLDFFPFPEISEEHGRKAVDAPIDGFMMAAEPRQRENATRLLAHLGSVSAQKSYITADRSHIAANKDVPDAAYDRLQRRSREIVASSSELAQFLDRDTRPDFASTVMVPSVQTFLRNPDDIDSLLESIEAQKRSIFVN